MEGQYMKITLEEVEQEYRKKIQETFDHEGSLTATAMVELMVNLSQELKVENISDNEDPDSDMLLYQYGTYDWGDELGKHFSFDITRQFIEPEEDEPYQLSFVLIYDPEPFRKLGSYDCWSRDFSDMESFISCIKTTDGFKLADEFAVKSYQLRFEQC